MYKKIDLSAGFPALESETRKFWQENNIIEKSLHANPDGEYFTFFDGPPTANGKPHVGHVLTRTIKDIIPRYKVMKGYQVLRKAGWDTHGLPVELEVEKKLGITGKADIEKYGVEKFIKECKESVFKYVSMWRTMSDKIGFWVDMDHPYVTYHNDYIESEWWALQQLWNKGLLYKGHKVMPYCPRCGTALSSHEVAQGYKDVKDITAFVKFKVKNHDNLYILAWTTTPWTLPANVALCVNKNYDYVEVEAANGEHYVLAQALTGILTDEYTVLRQFKGEEMLGMEYEQLLPFVKPSKRAFFVIHGDYVTLTDGTGIVHIAPAFGEDDNIVARQNDLPTINPVRADGTLSDEITPFAGMFVKDADPKIIDYLKEQGLLYKAEKHLHSYPHCWRCDTPLLYYPKESWFVKSTAYRDQLVENNNKINWYPDNIRTGRFGNFLENVIDWGISRDRYWGTPLPIWECACGHRELIGSIAELKEKSFDCPEEIELHKPYIDAVHLTCPECGKTMTRTHEVIDCWFDSGSMPFAQHHYPFENKETFDKNYPAQFISEAIDQTRGWFYTLHNLSTAIFERPCFENCIVLGHVLDGKGIKMSKHKGNIVEPDVVLDSVGADATRWHFYTSSAPWVPKRFSKEDVSETQRKFLMTFWNVYSFYILYADLDEFNPLKYQDFTSSHIMDRWILSKLNTLIQNVGDLLDEYKITNAALEIQDFVDELSNWYVRRNRARFWNGELTEDKIGAYTTLYRVLTTVSKISAPFVPFLTEQIYQSLVRSLDPDAPESVHMCRWPVSDPSSINQQLEAEMDLAYHIVELGRSARNTANIKNRQPLSGMLVSTDALPAYYADIVKDELNVKEITFGADLSKYVRFEIKPNLPVLGKAYGRYIPVIRNEIAAHNQMTLAQDINNGGSLLIHAEDGTEIVLNSENLLISMNGLEGYAFASSMVGGVVLDTTLTDELRNEGYLREVLSKVQNMRKESGFAVADHIRIYLNGDEKLLSLVEANKTMIMQETLADEIVYTTATDASSAKINDLTAQLAVEKL
ncbi:MAG TPA: isoleucine--tRNA ligase [Firmicutes bacterium]|nr:isoleucine--tRNA ligase [Bacillota bacterium]